MGGSGSSRTMDVASGVVVEPLESMRENEWAFRSVFESGVLDRGEGVAGSADV